MTNRFNQKGSLLKRAFDIGFSLFALCLLAPLFLLCLLFVKASSPGSVFYAHKRIGQGGRSFFCLKFRTMYRDAEEKLGILLASSPSHQAEWNTYFKLKKDPRITPFGKLLRKTSLDEIPQFWNVLRGDMSIVGPRPLTEHEILYYVKEKADTILSLKPGLTSLWIVQGRNTFSIEERVKMEEFYVKNRTLWLDCKIILKTALQVLFPKGAY